MSSEDASISIGIPQIIFCAVVLAIVYRYVINSPTAFGTTDRSGRSRASRPVSAETLATARSMFPQINPLAIRYDLERNGGNLEATAERILAEGNLPEPPATYIAAVQEQVSQQPVSSQSTRSLHAAAGANSSSSTSSSSTSPDLISRYNLYSKLQDFKLGAFEHPEASSAAKKNDKASLFLRGRERRDRMILEARIKMEERLKSS